MYSCRSAEMLSSKTLLVLTVLSLTVSATLAASQECLDIPSENTFQPEQVDGTWYPIEIIQHRNDSKQYGVPLDTKCPVVTFTKNRRVLTMVWNATEGEIKYTFQLKGNGRQAQWQATGEQTGSLATRLIRHFEGHIKLFRLDGDYLFLTICSKKKSLLLSTVALSRQEEMQEEVLLEILEELKTRYHKNVTNEIRLRPCTEDGPNHSKRLTTMSLLLLLPGAVIVLWTAH